jgi:hypothetical protein
MDTIFKVIAPKLWKFMFNLRYMVSGVIVVVLELDSGGTIGSEVFFNAG